MSLHCHIFYQACSTQHMADKVRYQLSRHEVLAFKDIGFQLQHMKVLSPDHMLSTIATLPIPHTNFCAPLNLEAHPTSRFGKAMRRNLATPMVDHENKWESIELINGYYVIGIIAIPYLRFWSVNQHCLQWGHCIPCHNWWHTALHMPWLHKKIHLNHWEGKGKWCNANIFIMRLDFCARWITIVISSFTLQRTPIMRLCNYLNLQVW